MRLCAPQLLASLSLLLMGCAVGPDYHAPAAPDVQHYTAQPLPSTTSATPGVAGGNAQHFAPGGDIPAQWWALFHNKRLDELVKNALQANPDLQAAQAALRVARENYLAATGAFWPSVGTSLQATRQKTPGALFGRPGIPGSIYTLYEAKAQVSYVPDVFGATRRQVEKQRAGVDYQRFELAASRLSLTANVVTTAIQAASLRQQLKVQHEISDAYSQNVDILRKQLNFGGASQAALQQAITLLAQARARIPPLQKQLAMTEDLLATLTGHFPSQMPALNITLDDLTLPASLPVSLPSRLVKQRPDVRAASARLHQASAAIGVAIANILPQFTITASLGTLASHPEDLFSPGGGLWSLAAGLTQPLFHGGELLHKKRAAEAAYDQAAAQYRSTVLTAFRDVADALRALHTDAAALQAQLMAAQAAGDGYRIARGQYQAGAVAYPALLQAGLSWQQAQATLVQAQAARFSDTAALFQALGGGWWQQPKITSKNGSVKTAARTGDQSDARQ